MSLNRTLAAAAALLLLAPALAAQGGTEVEEEKGIVITGTGIDRLELGGQIRGRAEIRDPAPPTQGSASRDFWLVRARVNLDAQISEPIRGYLQLQETVISEGTPSVDVLRQAYIELSQILDVATLQGGRFEMSYGNQRMISPLDWSPFARSWDGGRVRLDYEGFRLDGFYTQPVQGQGSLTSNQDFYGLYGEWDGEDVQVDLYGIKRRDLARALNDYTAGGILEGTVEGFFWSLEAALQRGTHFGLDAAGFALAVRVDADLGGGFKLGVGYEAASGDGNPADGDDGTFVTLFNFVHSYQGFSDIVIWQNLQDFVVRSKLPIAGTWYGTVDLHFLSRMEAADFLYPGPGGVGATAPLGGSRNIGTEIDVTARGNLAGSLDIWTGVSYFFAGSGIVNGDDQVWAFVMATLTF